jgi:hypothetical protein
VLDAHGTELVQVRDFALSRRAKAAPRRLFRRPQIGECRSTNIVTIIIIDG